MRLSLVTKSIASTVQASLTTYAKDVYYCSVQGDPVHKGIIVNGVFSSSTACSAKGANTGVGESSRSTDGCPQAICKCELQLKSLHMAQVLNQGSNIDYSTQMSVQLLSCVIKGYSRAAALSAQSQMLYMTQRTRKRNSEEDLDLAPKDHALSCGGYISVLCSNLLMDATLQGSFPHLPIKNSLWRRLPECLLHTSIW